MSLFLKLLFWIRFAWTFPVHKGSHLTILQSLQKGSAGLFFSTRTCLERVILSPRLDRKQAQPVRLCGKSRALILLFRSVNSAGGGAIGELDWYKSPIGVWHFQQSFNSSLSIDCTEMSSTSKKPPQIRPDFDTDVLWRPPRISATRQRTFSTDSNDSDITPS